MKHTLLPILLFIIAAQNTMAHATSRFDEVKPAVIDFFKRSAGNPKDCALLKDANAKNPQDEQTRMLMVGFWRQRYRFHKTRYVLCHVIARIPGSALYLRRYLR